MRPVHVYSLVVPLCLLISLPPQAVAEPLAPEVQRELLEKAARWHVPQPHADSKMLKIWVFQSGTKDKFALGFVEPGKPDQALVGFDHWDTTQRVEIKPIADPARLSLDDVTPTSPFSEVHGINFGLITGIQLLRRGEKELGGKLINQALQADAGHARSPFYSPANEAPVLMLARSCFAAALNEITSSKPDFPEIKQRIERLAADRPELKTEALQAVLEALQATVAHQPAPAGSIERVIDDYLLSGGTNGVQNFIGDEASAADRALILKGFEAVPALLKQRHSPRLTNHLMPGFNNFVSHPMTAGQVIDAYLQRLANNEFDSNWLRRQVGETAEDEIVLQWWKEASAMGEQAYVKQYTVTVDEEKHASLSDELLLLAEERYPALLPEFCRRFLPTPTPSWPAFEALMRSDTFTRDQKRQLLEEAIATNHDAHRNSALDLLQTLDPTLADKRLLKLLKEATPAPQGDYWTDQDANLSRYVSDSSDLEVWREFLALLDRADLGMRMELIDNLHPPHDAPPEILRLYHGIYVRFRDDQTVRDESASDKFSGPGAGFPHTRIEMRNFIHTHWGDWLKLERKSPKEDATAAEWKTYRTAVSMAIQQHHANPTR